MMSRLYSAVEVAKSLPLDSTPSLVFSCIHFVIILSLFLSNKYKYNVSCSIFYGKRRRRSGGGSGSGTSRECT
jgi:hypothetical protein